MLFRSVVRAPCLGPRHRGWSSGYPLQSLLEHFQCARQDERVSYGEMELPVPPFGCTFCTAPEMHHVLAVANEEGLVSLYKTESNTQIFREWKAHSNAVFDIAWVPGEHKLVTASGDQTAKLWDVRAGELIGSCKGHQCSLKSVAFSKFEQAVFCTGGRDGNIMVWDTRCNKKDGFYRQVNQISGAHNTLDKQTPSKSKKKKQTVRGLAPSVDSQQSVTVVLFQDEHTLVSTGAVDGVVKVWDLRKTYTAYRQDPVPSKAFPYPGTSTRKLGYSSLVLDSTGTNVFANCTDDNIYMFNLTGLKTAPVAVFSGHKNSTFYIKSSVSPDDEFLLSGSSDQTAYIWRVSDPQHPPMMLQGHSQEVTSVAWCPSDFTKIATCSDDNTVRIWRLNRGTGEEQTTAGQPDLVGWACQKEPENWQYKALHRTPDKIPRQQSRSFVSSPRPAACAPNYGGDLPLPTSTPTSSIKPLTIKSRTPARQAADGATRSPKPVSSSKMSIKNWVTRTPNSSKTSAQEAKTPSPRKVLEPVEVQAVSTAKPLAQSEKRVKRRLETSREKHSEKDCAQHCSCVTELDPAVKRIKLDLCSSEGGVELATGEPCLDLAQLSQADDILGQGTPATSPPGSPLAVMGFGTPSPPPSKFHCDLRTGLAGKENSSPEGRNWLSALGDKLKTDKPCCPSGTCTSPSSTKTPIAKRQLIRSAASSPVSVPSTPGSMRKICTYFHKKSPE
ncbi:denticleless protein homolog [Ambystoma mexicanum]|uniref:denticleless protein homolog n=1 Tax=Ambystoma mexicanum TaxID=8296 RepID=UPI0037E8B6BD